MTAANPYASTRRCVCGRQLEDSVFKTCRPCREKGRVTSQNNRERGLCHCGGELSGGFKTCEKCRSRALGRFRAHTSRGLCPCWSEVVSRVQVVRAMPQSQPRPDPGKPVSGPVWMRPQTGSWTENLRALSSLAAQERPETPQPCVVRCTDRREVVGSFSSRAPQESPYLECLPAVTPGQSSVRKGVSGSRARLRTLHTGLSAQA